MKILENYDSKANFWKVNPQLTAAGPFKPLYENDCSAGKVVSSKKMWCVSLAYDPGSKYFNMPEEDKLDLLFTDIMGDTKFLKANRDIINELRDFYRKLLETPARRSLRGVEDKLNERDLFLKNTEYTLGELGNNGQWVGGTADLLDKMMANTVKMWDLYDKALKVVSDEAQVGVAFGGGSISLTDSGDI